MALDRLPSKGNWQSKISTILESRGMPFVLDAREIFVTSSKNSIGEFECVDGLVIRPMWLGHRRSGLSITSRRRYYITGTGQVVNRPEWQILPRTRRPVLPSAEKRLDSQQLLLKTLISELNPTPGVVKLHPLFEDITDVRQITISGNTVDTKRNTLNESYKTLGFDHVPNNFTISICPLDGSSNSHVQDFKRLIKKTALARSARVNVHITDPKKVLSQLDDLITGQASRIPQKGKCVLFLLPDKQREISSLSKQIFELADRARVPFRRAYSTDNFDVSIPGQFPSLLTSAGGISHTANSNVRQNRLWTLGIDKSFPRGENRSVMAITLVDPAGGLKAAWISSHSSRDETVHLEPLEKILVKCKDRLKEMDFSGEILILRDGRRFENEMYETYPETLKATVSFLEIRKRPNVQVFNHYGPKFQVRTPCAGTISDITTTMFLSTTSPKSGLQLPRFMKVTWRDWENELQLSAKEIAKILITSAAAPNLGQDYQHLPAAIYWADGIAGRSDSDLRFRGIPVEVV